MDHTVPSEHHADLRARPTEFAIVFLAVAALLIFKSPDVLTQPQFFAEDGTIFFQQQYGHAYPLIFTSYAGYLHFIPRLVAWLASFFPYLYAPLIYNVFTLVIDAYAITYFSVRSGFIVPYWVIIAVFLFVPTNGEMFGTLAYAQWFLQFALFAAAIYPSDSASTKKNKWTYAAIFAASLTGPFSIFCAFIAVSLFIVHSVMVRLFSRQPLTMAIRDWWLHIDKYVLVIVALGAAIQLAIIFLSPRYVNPDSEFSLRVLASLWLIGTQIHTFGIVIIPKMTALVVSIALLLFVLVRLWRRPDIETLVILGMIVFAVLQLTGISSHATLNTLVGFNLGQGDRYYFFLKIVFWISVALAVKRLQIDQSGPLSVIVLMVFVALVNQTNLRRPLLQDMHWEQAARALDSGEKTVTIPINPKPWEIVIAR